MGSHDVDISRKQEAWHCWLMYVVCVVLAEFSSLMLCCDLAKCYLVPVLQLFYAVLRGAMIYVSATTPVYLILHYLFCSVYSH